MAHCQWCEWMINSCMTWMPQMNDVLLMPCLARLRLFKWNLLHHNETSNWWTSCFWNCQSWTLFCYFTYRNMSETHTHTHLPTTTPAAPSTPRMWVTLLYWSRSVGNGSKVCFSFISWKVKVSSWFHPTLVLCFEIYRHSGKGPWISWPWGDLRWILWCLAMSWPACEGQGGGMRHCSFLMRFKSRIFRRI